MPWYRRHGPLLAFILVAIVAGWALHAQQVNTGWKLYHNSYQSCIRGNHVRANQSNIVRDLRTSNKVVVQFLQDASVARANSYQFTHVPADAKAAVEYSTLAIKLSNDTSKLRSYPSVNCSSAVKKP